MTEFLQDYGLKWVGASGEDGENSKDGEFNIKQLDKEL